MAVALVIAVAFVVIAILMPIAAMVGTSLSADALPVFERYTIGPQRQILLNTVILGVTVAAVGTVIGFLFAYVQVRVPLPRLLKRFIHLMALLPIVSPPFALALSAIVLFGRSGIITRDLLGIDFNIYGLQGMVLVMSLSFFPVAYISLAGLMRALDPALDEAATNLGASRWRTFRTVTFPLLLPGLASGFLLLFVEALADLGNPIVLGGNFQVLASRMYLAIIGQYDTLAGAVLGILLLVPSLIVYFVHRYYAERASVVSVTGKPSGRPAELTHRPVALLLTVLTIGVSLLVLLMYATIVWGAFTNLVGVDNTLTTKNFEFVLFGYGLEAVSDTVLLAAIATPLAGAAGGGHRVPRHPRPLLGTRGARLRDDARRRGARHRVRHRLPAELQHADRGRSASRACRSSPAGPAILGGAIAIVMVFVVRSVPGGLRSGAAALQQIDPTIEEASVSLGADQTTTFRRVVLPLIRPAFLTGLIYSFARSMTAISAIVFLTTPSTRIMTQQILNETNAARFGNALAYCVILIVIVLAAIGFLYWIIGSSTRVDRGVAEPAEATLVRST